MKLNKLHVCFVQGKTPNDGQTVAFDEIKFLRIGFAPENRIHDQRAFTSIAPAAVG
jgi:hypothetical protein